LKLDFLVGHCLPPHPTPLHQFLKELKFPHSYTCFRKNVLIIQKFMLMILERRVQEEDVQVREHQGHSDVQGETSEQLNVQHEASKVHSVG
jgi:hypothetical protein